MFLVEIFLKFFVGFAEIFFEFFIGFEIFEEICVKFFVDHGAKEEARRPGVEGGLPYALPGQW